MRRSLPLQLPIADRHRVPSAAATRRPSGSGTLRATHGRTDGTWSHPSRRSSPRSPIGPAADAVAAPIAGGLTNRTTGSPWTARRTSSGSRGAGTDLLAVDRGERASTTRGQPPRPGLGARVLHHLPAWDVIVLEWLDARTMSNAAFRTPGEPTRIAAALRRLHAGPRFRDDFDMVALAARYLRVVDERGDLDPGRLSRAPGPSRGSRPRWPGASACHRPLPQRPARRELPRRRRAAVDRRLRVQRQQRPGVRARQHVPGAGLRRRPRP